jgi:hypothetical protein
MAKEEAFEWSRNFEGDASAQARAGGHLSIFFALMLAWHCLDGKEFNVTVYRVTCGRQLMCHGFPSTSPMERLPGIPEFGIPGDRCWRHDTKVLNLSDN